MFSSRHLELQTSYCELKKSIIQDIIKAETIPSTGDIMETTENIRQGKSINGMLTI